MEGELADRIREVLARRPAVLEGYLFGSQARGEAQAHGDIDVAVYLDPDRPADDPLGADSAVAAELMSAFRLSRVVMVIFNQAYLAGAA